MLSRRNLMSVSAIAGLTACAPRSLTAAEASSADIGFEVFDLAFETIIDIASPARLLSTGHWWSEGPAWDAERQTLYFTDVPRNRAYSWSKAEGEAVFLSPSGVEPDLAEGMREAGANGLLVARHGELLICNHGKRAVEARDFASGERRVLTSEFQGKRFNSPNDLIEAADGTIYFTDPPYGLEGLNASPAKEMSVNGVYRLGVDASVTRLVDDMTFPNGIALSPDGRWLYVSQSDPAAPMIRRFKLGEDGSLVARKTVGEDVTWFDAKPYMHEVGGLPDGMAVTRGGYVMLAGPGGVLVITPDGACLGRIFTGRASANCAFGEDGRTLFITAGDRLVAVRTKVQGLGRF